MKTAKTKLVKEIAFIEGLLYDMKVEFKIDLIADILSYAQSETKCWIDDSNISRYSIPNQQPDTSPGTDTFS